MSIYQNHARAVDRNARVTGPVGDSQLKTVARQFVNDRLRTGEKIPASMLRVQFLGIAA